MTAAGPDRGLLGELVSTQNLPATMRTAEPAMPAAEPPATPEPQDEVVEPKTRAPRHRKPGERWEDRNVRRTFHLPVALVEDLEAVTDRLDVTLSAAVREALAAWIAERQPS